MFLRNRLDTEGSDEIKRDTERDASVALVSPQLSNVKAHLCGESRPQVTRILHVFSLVLRCFRGLPSMSMSCPPATLFESEQLMLLLLKKDQKGCRDGRLRSFVTADKQRAPLPLTPVAGIIYAWLPIRIALPSSMLGLSCNLQQNEALTVVYYDGKAVSRTRKAQ